MTTWFTADTHFSHANIIKYCNRPFKNVWEHDKTLIQNWNDRVQKNDIIYHLGDFGFGAKGYLIEIIKQLNGKIHFIRGNHDKSMKGDLLYYLAEDVPYKEISIADPEINSTHKQKIILCHYAFEVWNKKHYGSWHLHGHCIDKDTEILTPTGWKTYNQSYPGMMTYSIDPHMGTLQIDQVANIIESPSYNGQIVNFKGKGLNFNVTNLHSMIRTSRDGNKIYTELAKDLIKKNRVTLIRSILRPNYDIGISNISDDMLRLYILINADGSLCNTDLIRIVVKKKHKQKYISKILTKLNIDFRKKIRKDNYISFNFTLPSKLKQFRIKGLDFALINCSLQQFKVILDAYVHSDGYLNNGNPVVFTSKKEEADLLQHLATILGYTSTCYKRENHGFSIKPSYQIYFTQKTHTTYVDFNNRVSLLDSSGQDYWCIEQTKNSNFICRRHGQIHVTGNSHGTLSSPDHMARLDVGVDVHNYAPISYEDVKFIMTRKVFKPLNSKKKIKGLKD